ncbi:hypothetical protein MBM_06554 [Drepanopeziza brunnea f. sp. 'multigermtubi' MB_m1]|uniref:Uncharacterized protein n=1 Tax=Marssonina brunnea f. sp. multigermtubi (strain MB_m1) TaxID=1072389 RepID=K1X3N6_MARBU|nr:uncharacterized protein MBM_06554 [Drepanopeziza brunnea f. sp. 'multigermtubi' MB_m1]EKD15338.1 hypothetical protein MBM_06554 [Drepanopeziza brunnea f. sp. 'multigermtubi' MB_m1]
MKCGMPGSSRGLRFRPRLGSALHGYSPGRPHRHCPGQRTPLNTKRPWKRFHVDGQTPHANGTIRHDPQCRICGPAGRLRLLPQSDDVTLHPDRSPTSIHGTPTLCYIRQATVTRSFSYRPNTPEAKACSERVPLASVASPVPVPATSVHHSALVWVRPAAVWRHWLGSPTPTSRRSRDTTTAWTALWRSTSTSAYPMSAIRATATENKDQDMQSLQPVH